MFMAMSFLVVIISYFTTYSRFYPIKGIIKNNKFHILGHFFLLSLLYVMIWWFSYFKWEASQTDVDYEFNYIRSDKGHIVMHTIKAHGRCAFIEKKRLLVSIEISNRTFSETDFNVYSVVHFCLNILNETRNNSWHFFYSYERIKIRFQVFNQNRNNKRFDLISNGD